MGVLWCASFSVREELWEWSGQAQSDSALQTCLLPGTGRLPGHGFLARIDRDQVIFPFRRYRRHTRGLCVRCAYDLTGNTSGACPECGTPATIQSHPARADRAAVIVVWTGKMIRGAIILLLFVAACSMGVLWCASFSVREELWEWSGQAQSDSALQTCLLPGTGRLPGHGFLARIDRDHYRRVYLDAFRGGLAVIYISPRAGTYPKAGTFSCAKRGSIGDELKLGAFEFERYSTTADWRSSCQLVFLQRLLSTRVATSHAWITRVQLPAWAPFVLLGAYPFTMFMRGPLRRYRRRKRGLCVRCGYDLTGNVSGVCSECGASL